MGFSKALKQQFTPGFTGETPEVLGFKYTLNCGGFHETYAFEIYMYPDALG